jgi:23S rRNA pseudouridine2605 synthase
MPFKKRPYEKFRPKNPYPGRSDAKPYGKREQKSAYPGVRIAKVVARAGLGSRRDVEAAIIEGRVGVNGRIITSPALNVLPDDKITVDGKALPQREHTRLWLYHKPKDLVTTERDPEGRPTVFDNLPEDIPRVMSIGRLDINTEGLLLLTNDGSLKRVLELPSTGWLRRYRVRAFGSVTQEKLDSLKNGVSIDGVDYGPVEVELERSTGQNLWLAMGIREGKNREIKNIAEHLGLVVNRLIRISFGPFQLRDLEPNEVREISLRLLQDQLGPRLMREAEIDFGSGKRSHRRPIEPIKKREYDNQREPSATGKAERYARMQESGDRFIKYDNNSKQLRLAPKTIDDRKGRKVTVSKNMRSGYKKKFESRDKKHEFKEKRFKSREDYTTKSSGKPFHKKFERPADKKNNTTEKSNKPFQFYQKRKDMRDNRSPGENRTDRPFVKKRWKAPEDERSGERSARPRPPFDKRKFEKPKKSFGKKPFKRKPFRRDD